MILLFPGEWHSYYPDRETGWDEYWVGFRGIHIDKRVEKKFFTKEEPLHRIGLSATIVGLYTEVRLGGEIRLPTDDLQYRASYIRLRIL